MNLDHILYAKKKWVDELPPYQGGGGMISEVKKDEMDDLEGADIMHEINNIISSWVEETPEQWLWIHRRWKNAEIKS